jgi:hypothetical protein
MPSVKRRIKDKWIYGWDAKDLRYIDDKAAYFRSVGAIDDESAWEMAQQEYFHATRNTHGWTVS